MSGTAEPAARARVARALGRGLGRARARGPAPAPLLVRGLGQPRRAQHRGFRRHKHDADRGRRDPPAPSRHGPSTSFSRRSTSGPSSEAAPADYQRLRGRPLPASVRRRIVSSIGRSSSLAATAVGAEHRGVAPHPGRGARGRGRHRLDQGGVVTLDLEPIVLEAADRIGFGSRSRTIPEDVGRVEILRSDQLDTAQDGFQILKALAWLLPSSHSSRSRSRPGSPGIGAARSAVSASRIVVAAVVGLVAVSVVGNYVVNSLVSETENRTAASNAWDILADLLREYVLVDDPDRGPLRRGLVARRPRTASARRAALPCARPSASGLAVRCARGHRGVPRPDRAGQRFVAVPRRRSC